MKKTILAVACIMIALIGRGTAQPPVSLPADLAPGPLVITKIPGSAQWTIDYTYSNTPKPGEATTLDKLKQQALNDPALAKAMQNPQYLFTLQNIRPIHTVVTRVGNVTHEESTYEQQYTGEKWSNREMRVERRPYAPSLIATINLDPQGDDFPEFHWIAKDNFIGIETHDDRKCLVFKKDQYTPEGDFIGTANAYVDFTTRLPVGYQIVFETRKYTILPPPSADISLPPEVVASGKAMLDRIQKATPKLATP